MSFISAARGDEGPAEKGKKRGLYSGVAVFVIPSSLSEEFELHADRDFGVSYYIAVYVDTNVYRQSSRKFLKWMDKHEH